MLVTIWPTLAAIEVVPALLAPIHLSLMVRVAKVALQRVCIFRLYLQGHHSLTALGWLCVLPRVLRNHHCWLLSRVRHLLRKSDFRMLCAFGLLEDALYKRVPSHFLSLDIQLLCGLLEDCLGLGLARRAARC